MTEDSLITEEAEAMIGKELPPRVVGEVYKRDIQRFALATGDPNRSYFDEEYAKESRHGGIIAPPSFIITFFSERGSDVEIIEDGHIVPRSGEELRPLLRAKRALGGGSELEFFEPLRPGDVISAKKKITDIYEKEGRSGKLVFTITETTYTNQRGEVVVIDRGTSIAR
jgi:acyl dehydratase